MVNYSGFFQGFFIQPKHEAPILDRVYRKYLPFPNDDLGGNQQYPWGIPLLPVMVWNKGRKRSKSINN